MGTCNVAQELKASGTDDVAGQNAGGLPHLKCGPSRKCVIYAADTTGQTHPDSSQA